VPVVGRGGNGLVVVVVVVEDVRGEESTIAKVVDAAEDAEGVGL